MSNEDQIWIVRDNQKEGPFAEADLRRQMIEGKLPQATLAWRTGAPDWTSLVALLGKPEVKLPPPPPPYAAKPTSRPTSPSHGQPAANGTKGSAEPSALQQAVGLKTLHFVLLTLVTAGIYPIMWLYKNGRIIEQVTGEKIVSNAYVLWMAFLAARVAVNTGVVPYAFSDDTATFSTVASLFMWIASYIALGVMFIVWAFKAKRALEAYAARELGMQWQLNSAWTFILSLFYINYCINDLPAARQRAPSYT